MSTELWIKQDYPKIKNGVVRVACEQAQKEVLKKRLAVGITKEMILASYFDHNAFYAYNVEQVTYKSLTQYLQREAYKGALIKCSYGRGSYAKYIFPKKEIERMVDEILRIPNV